MADDIEAMNRIRVAMGFDPLPGPGGDSGPVFKQPQGNESQEEEGDDVNVRQARAGDNWQQLQAKKQAETERLQRKEKLRKERERAQLNAKLVGKGLGDADEPDMDTKSWLLSQKKRQKKIEKSRKLQQEMEERERLAQEAEYTSKDLAGVAIGHELGEFDEGNEQILTLKDNAVDDSDVEDELENTTLREREKAQERMDSKKRKRIYDPNEDASGKGILAQYDDENAAKKGKRFTLDGLGSTAEAAQAAQEQSGRSKGITISLDALEEVMPVSDYAEPVEVKVKKPKKKKTKHSRKKVTDDDDVPEANAATPSGDRNGMGLDNSKKEVLNSDILDDDDLQSRLARQRREALRKKKKVSPEDVARQIREEASTTPADVMNTVEDGDEDEQPGLVIDETSRFVENLEKPSTPPPGNDESLEADMAVSPSGSADHDSDLKMDDIDEAEDGEWKAEEERNVPAGPGTGAGLDEEHTISKGMGSTLSLLRQRGLLEDVNGALLNDAQRSRQNFLAHKHRAELESERRARHQRDIERQSGRLDHMSAKEKEDRARNANTSRDHQDARRMAEMFSKEYRPNIDIKYHDEHGRSLDQKEAFKHLSHQFHGKGSGKGKTEKMLKKIEDEKRRMAQSSLDSSEARAMTYNAADKPAERREKVYK